MNVTQDELNTLHWIMKPPEKISIPCDPRRLSPKQRAVYRDNSYIVLLVAANGTGKSLLECLDAAHMMLGLHERQAEGGNRDSRQLGPLGPPIRIRHLAPSFENGVKGVLLKKYMGDGVNPPLIPPSLVKVPFSDKSPQIVLHNDSWVQFGTYEQKVSHQAGAEFDKIIYDEEPPFHLWEENRQRLRSAKDGRGQILIGMTPSPESQYTMSWTFEKLWSNPDTDISKHQLSKYDLVGYHPNVTLESIERDKRLMTDEEFRIRVMGEYVALSGRLYPEYKDTYQPEGHLLKRFTIDPRVWPIYFALDWHDRKPAAAIWATKDNQSNIIFFDELKRRETEGLTIKEVCQLIKMKEAAYGITEGVWEMGNSYRLIDPSAAKKENALIAGFNPLEEFARFGIYCAPAANDMIRVDLTKRYLKSDDSGIWPQARFFDDLSDTRHDMQFVQYEDYKYLEDRDPKGGKIKDRYKCLPDCASYILNHEGMMVQTDEEDRKEVYIPEIQPVYHRGNVSLGAY